MTVKELINELMEHDMEREIYIEINSDEEEALENFFDIKKSGAFDLKFHVDLSEEVIVQTSDYKELVEFKDEREGS